MNRAAWLGRQQEFSEQLVKSIGVLSDEITELIDMFSYAGEWDEVVSLALLSANELGIRVAQNVLDEASQIWPDREMFELLRTLKSAQTDIT